MVESGSLVANLKFKEKVGGEGVKLIIYLEHDCMLTVDKNRTFYPSYHI